MTTQGVGIVGTGYVADYYKVTLADHDGVSLVGVADQVDGHAARYSEHHDVFQFESVDALLADPRVGIVANLTNPSSHYEVSKAALEAGKHVYSEKPIATDLDEAKELVALADERGLHISSAPCSLLGETAQTLWRAVRQQKVGQPLLVYAEMDEGLVHQMPFQNWVSEAGAPWPARDEFEMGTVMEHAGYVVTWLPAIFGPAITVRGFADCLIPTKAGWPVDGTDFSVGIITFASGVVARVSCTLIAPHDHSVRVVGDKGVLSIEDTWFYGSAVKLRTSINIGPRHQEFPKRKVKMAGEPKKYGYRGTQQMDFARGIADLAAAIDEGRAPRLSKEYCLHTNEIVLALDKALREQSTYEMTTTCGPVDPMPWAR